MLAWEYECPDGRFRPVEPFAEVELEEAFNGRADSVRVVLEEDEPPVSVELACMTYTSDGRRA